MVIGSSPAPGRVCKTASKTATSSPAPSSATEAKASIEWAPGVGPFTSMSVTTWTGLIIPKSIEGIAGAGQRLAGHRAVAAVALGVEVVLPVAGDALAQEALRVGLAGLAPARGDGEGVALHHCGDGGLGGVAIQPLEQAGHLAGGILQQAFEIGRAHV